MKFILNIKLTKFNRPPSHPYDRSGLCIVLLRGTLVSTMIRCAWGASAACSRRVYRVSASDMDLLTKNIGLYFRFSSSLNNVALTEMSKIAK